MAGWVEFERENVLAGFAANDARGGEQVALEVEGFYTSDDGPKIFGLLDQVYASVLRPATNLTPEQIKMALVNIIGRRVRVLVNPPVRVHALPKRGVEQGSLILLDDLADIASIEFPGCDLPSNGSLMFIFRHQWRHGLFFNLRHVHEEFARPIENVSALLGSAFGALLQRERIRMDASVLAKMAAAGWFPFSRISTTQAVRLHTHFDLDWDPKEVVDRIRAEVDPKLSEIVDGWATKPAFAPHIDVFREAVGLYAEGKYRPTAMLLWPKVEGVLRHVYAGSKKSPKSHELRQELVGRVRANVEGYTALLPESFVAYLETYYYAGFDLNAGELPPSRHAYMHGVGPDELLLDPIYSLRLFLMLDQVFFCVSRMKEPTADTERNDGVAG